MNKEIVYSNISNMINNGLFLDKYIELTKDYSFDINDDKSIEYLEHVAADIFNAILIGCQLFDDEDRIKEFVNKNVSFLDSSWLEMTIENYGITREEALERLKHGFGVHFTTTNICEEIKKTGYLAGYGTNTMFTSEEDKIITDAANEQKANDPEAMEKLNYLFRGWGTGVSSFGSMTNHFWMYHTPESLSFLFGNISMRDKDRAMKYVESCITALSDENKKLTLDTMSKIYDRLIGDKQEVGCILIDRDAFKYEVDYYYRNGEAIPVERRPYSNGFSSLMNSDSQINGSIDVSNLKFLKIPTVLELERQKSERLGEINSNRTI